MPELRNPRHECFAQQYAMNGNATQSYVEAFGAIKGAAQAGARLFKRSDMQARLEEIRNATAARNEITQDSLVQDFQNIHDKAMLDPKTYMAATNAKVAQAKICGLWNERLTVATESMSDAELVKALEGSGSIIDFEAALKASRGKT